MTSGVEGLLYRNKMNKTEAEKNVEDPSVKIIIKKEPRSVFSSESINTFFKW